MVSSKQQHWQQVYQTKAVDEVSWFQAEASLSFRLLTQLAASKKAKIIDVGSGASLLADKLIDNHFNQLTLVDISAKALAIVKQRLAITVNAQQTSQIQYYANDVLNVELPHQYYDLWHDRAVFHFLTSTAEQQAYIAQMKIALKPNAKVVIATFAENGPEQCSGLPVCRYSPEFLTTTLGAEFQLLASHQENHQTPWQSTQAFNYCVFEYQPLA